MKLLARRSFLLSILLLGTQVISIPGLPLSLFQLSLIVSCVLSFFAIRKVKSSRFLWSFIIVYAISSLLAYFVSINPDSRSYFLLSLMTLFSLFLVPHFFNRSDIDLLEKTLIRSQYIVIPFAVYTFIVFYFLGGLPNEIYLPGGLSIMLEKEDLLRGQAGGQLRLMLPYSTPPMLSVVMSMCIVILFYNKKLFSNRIRLFLLVLFSLILVLTGSRTGIIGLGVFAAMHMLFNVRSLPKWSIWAMLFVGLFLGVLVLFSSEVEFLEKYLTRFARLGQDGFEEDRHFLVPIDGIIIWSSSLRNFVVGIGLASSAMMSGAHTDLPPHFLNSYVTLIAERGIMGFALAALLILLGIRLYSKRRVLSRGECGLVYSFIVALFSFLFYECLNCYFVIFVTAIAMMLDWSVSRPKIKRSI